MADAYLTSADVLNFNRVDLDVLVSDVLDSTPFLQRAAARTAESDNFKYTKLLTNPSVGYRAVNDGVENVKATYSQISVDLKYLYASFAVDIAAAKVDERGQDHIMGIEARNHLRAAMRVIENNIFNTTSGGFDGFADQSNLNGLADAQVVDAGGTAASISAHVAVLCNYRSGLSGRAHTFFQRRGHRLSDQVRVFLCPVCDVVPVFSQLADGRGF